MVSEPVVDGRRVESLVQAMRRYAPHYTPELNLTDEQSVAPALMRIAAQLAEAVLVRVDRTPRKNFVAFLDRLGISLLPARPARAAVTFRPVAGGTEPVRVPAGTRVSAPGEEADIPFETSGELLAIPGALVAAYGVDPTLDKIFRHPPDFLAQEVRTPTELVYEVQAFAAAGSSRIQLNHTTELTPGAFIRVGASDEYVVAKVEDTIVTLEQLLARDVPDDTRVTPIRDFEAFDGIDLQEHVLYLGHADLFTVKDKAEIVLDVQLVGGAGLQPFDIAWQFWTKPAGDAPDIIERWESFEIASDETGGLTASGAVALAKPDNFEIKERQVGGVTSRWIRAYLRDKLPSGTRPLPAIDRIGITVRTGDEEDIPEDQRGIPADQGFHNATPLDVQVAPDVGFLPFGPEPRQFDQFYVASEEAFSKRGAEVTLKLQLDLQTLATPSLTVIGGQLHAYSIGLRRSLYDLDVDTGDWELLGTPAETEIPERPKGSRFVPVEDSAPSALPSGATTLVFVNTEDSLAAENATNRLWVNVPRSHLDPAKCWKDLGAPGPTPPQVRFSPAAVLAPGWPAPHFGRVFVVAGDGKLYSRSVTDTGDAEGAWSAHGSPPGVTALSSPAFVTLTSNDDMLVFVNADGVVHRLVLRSSGVSEWTSLKQFGAQFTAVSRPFAQAYGGGDDAKVFVFGRERVTEEWRLFECDAGTPVNGEFPWIDHGAPSAGAAVDERPEAHAPAGFLERPDEAIDIEGKHIFLRGADNHLYELLDPEEPGEEARWVDRSRRGRPDQKDDPPLRDSPAVQVAPVLPITIRVIVASVDNSLVAWEFEIRTDNVPVPADALAQAVRLTDEASDADDAYLGGSLEIASGAGAGTGARNVDVYDGPLRLARVSPDFSTLPNHTSAIRINSQPVANARDGTENLFALHDPPVDAVGNHDHRRASLLELRWKGEIRTTDLYSRISGVVSITGVAPPAGDIVLYAELLNVTSEYLPLEDRSTAPNLSWEYWNGRGWLSLAIIDKTAHLLKSGDVTFEVPQTIERTEVAGQDNFWIRARLVGGDYGRETFKLVNNVVVSERSTLRPPKITQLRIVYETPPVPPAVALTFNNLDYIDQTAASNETGAHFRPFERLESFRGRTLSLFLGFDKPFRTGPVRILVDAAEREFDETKPPEFDWSFRKDRLWRELSFDDGSVALTRPGILTVVASDTLTRETRFGEPLFWIRGSLRTDRAGSGAYPRPLLRGLYVNTASAEQGETITEEIAGSSDGEPDQQIRLQHADILEGEDIRVREALSAEEREEIERVAGPESVVDREDLGGTWVRWTETTALFDARPDDRVYLLDRANGLLQFGDGTHGRIPQAGVDNIRAFSYRTGGGAKGNVAAGEIKTLVTAVAGIEAIFNPTPAGGGSDKADTQAMLTIGPRRISHRDRAVSAEDFEEIAFEASRQVAKARCLVTTNLAPSSAAPPDPCDAALRHEARQALGWVSLIIVPYSDNPLPCPTLELRRTVREYLRERAPSVLAASDRIVVRPPDYVEVSIEADVIVTSLDQASAAETRARETLEALLHPLTGGPDGAGWEFGRPIWKSDVLAALKPIGEIDRVENLRFRFHGGTHPERVVIGPNELLASGRHVLAIKESARDAARSS